MGTPHKNTPKKGNKRVLISTPTPKKFHKKPAIVSSSPHPAESFAAMIPSHAGILL